MILNASDPRNLERAARLIRRGGVVAFPTETVYGLGADARNVRAVCRIFEIKGRPRFDPLIVHVASRSQARSLWTDIPPLAEKLMRRFWPGPLTLILPKTKAVPDVVTAGLTTVAVRLPDNLFARRLIRFSGCALAAPSANYFGSTSLTTAEAVEEEFGKRVDMVLDGGPCGVGVESTVLKVETHHTLLLRPGGTPLEAVRQIARVLRQKSPSMRESPGLLASHYAPRTPLCLLDRGLRRKLSGVSRMQGAYLCFGRKKRERFFRAVESLSERRDIREAAANLFHTLRKLDKMQLKFIIADPVPRHGIGLAVMDRLRRASSEEGRRRFLENLRVCT